MSLGRYADFKFYLQLFSDSDLGSPDLGDLSWTEELLGFQAVGGGAVPLSAGSNSYDISFFCAQPTLVALRMTVPGTVSLFEMPGSVAKGVVPVSVIDDRYAYLILSAPGGTNYLTVDVAAAGEMLLVLFGDKSA
jgi:hypothetical protein